MSISVYFFDKYPSNTLHWLFHLSKKQIEKHKIKFIQYV